MSNQDETTYDDPYQQGEDIVDEGTTEQDGGLDDDSTMKSEEVANDWPEGRRRDALNMACATVGSSGSAARILDAAKQFEDYLKDGSLSEPKVTYPYKDDQGNTVLGEGILLSEDNTVVLVGQNVYRYSQTLSTT